MRIIGRIVRYLAILSVVGIIGMAIFMRTTTDDPAVWHADPATSDRTGKPNDYVVAPEGATTATADTVSKVHATDPKSLLFQLDAIVQNAGAAVVSGSVDELWITYSERTMVLGFPDYISVKAVEVEGGSALIIWSRSRYGHSDFGVNRKRVDGWLEKLGG